LSHCLILQKFTYIYWPIECTSKAWFIKLFELAKITYIYWQIECTPRA
jgi:hypothetical protein